MPAASGYTTVNIDLSNGYETYGYLMSTGGRLYIIFWWKNIPLGDLYYCGGRNETEIQTRQMLRHAIANSVSLYVQKYQFLFDESTISGSEQGPGLLNLLHSLFSRREMLPCSGKLDLSVVICTRNRSEELKQCLKSLLSQDFLPNEIIVVDNAPNDNSTRIICEEFPGVTYVLEKGIGLDLARNTGARHAGSSIVAYTDDDVLLTQNWCYEVWSTFQQEDIDAMTGLVIASSLETESQVIFEKHWSFNKGYTDKLFDSSFLTSVAPRVWEIGAGANMAFRRTALQKANYFDKRLDAGRAGCSGDSEIWFRLLHLGCKIYYNPRAVVFHKHRREISSLKNQLYFYMRGHATATMIQHKLSNQYGYLTYLRMSLPRYYLTQLRKGFPFYRGRYMTLGNEIKGLISGVKYFYSTRSEI
jgi:glycosyltransferase involved in cell wall biosynthesis